MHIEVTFGMGALSTNNYTLQVYNSYLLSCYFINLLLITNYYLNKIWPNKTAQPETVLAPFVAPYHLFFIFFWYISFLIFKRDIAQAVTWIGLASYATVNATYYIDNIVYLFLFLFIYLGNRFISHNWTLFSFSQCYTQCLFRGKEKHYHKVCFLFLL